MLQFLQHDTQDALPNASLCPRLGHLFTPDPRTHMVGRRLALAFYPQEVPRTHLQSHASQYLCGSLIDLGKEFCVPSEKKARNVEAVRGEDQSCSKTAAGSGSREPCFFLFVFKYCFGWTTGTSTHTDWEAVCGHHALCPCQSLEGVESQSELLGFLGELSYQTYS